MAYNMYREKKIEETKKQIQFCKELMLRLDIDYTNTVDEQNANKWDTCAGVKNKYRYMEDVRRLRRELVSLEKIMSED